MQRGSVAVEVHENEILPGIYANGHKAVVGAIEIADAVELHHAFERAIDSVSPSMVRAAKLLGAALRLGDDGRSVVPANIVESAEPCVVAAHNDDGFARDVGSEELARVAHLV